VRVRDTDRDRVRERDSGCVLQSKEDHSTDVIFAPRQGIGMANVFLFLRRRLSKRFFFG
jgi:hypothetical protein